MDIQVWGLSCREREKIKCTGIKACWMFPKKARGDQSRVMERQMREKRVDEVRELTWSQIILGH